ncbi:hypothetical protein AX15_002834 [Amanita polypyramis BW_CC]|nr:hypothetical protein AX15_002834 [Amanita polypyramis BW_CC]
MSLEDIPSRINDRVALPSSASAAMLASAPFASFSSTTTPSSMKKRTNSSVPLYPSVPNLPCSFVGPTYTSRRADGGGNNVLFPDIGRAGMAYARNVPSEHRFEALPEPGLVFDTLLKARDKRVHPLGASSLTYAFAQLVAYSLYNTDSYDWSTNATTSYLDLSLLYGIDEERQSQVRDKESGRGLLFPDTFTEDRLALAPPAVIALLVIFSRNHNYIAERLFSINERKRWTDPPPSDEASRAKQDEEIFQTARLVNCTHFLNVMISDYLPTFLGLSEDSSWTRSGGIDLSQLRKQAAIKPSHGVHSSVEFNLLYRWQAALSQVDIRWTEDRFNQLFGRKSFDKITIDELERVTREFQSSATNVDPRRRTFSQMSRGFDGRFDDEELASVLLDATEDSASALRARGTSAVFRSSEILAIEQSRYWGVCSLNEFRVYLGLKAFESFEEWCAESVISNTARRLYGHIDNLELYPGLQCEAPSDSPYSCGYTMTKAILADAVRLIQGDRFYTMDFSPRNLTSWGYLDCQKDTSSANSGGQLSRLLMRHLQRHYPYNSVYGCFPFSTPQKMKESLTKQGIADRYTFDRPTPVIIPKILDSSTSIRHVMNEPETFPPVYELRVIQDEQEFQLSVESGIDYKAPDKIFALEALFPNKDALQRHGEWFRESISRKIKERSWKYGGIKGTTVDIVRDVINASLMEWVAEHLFGIPLKTDAYPEGLYTESELYDILAKLYNLKYPSVEDTENGFSLRQSVRASHVILDLIAKEILALKPVISPKAFLERITVFKGQKQSEQEDEKPSFELLNKLASSDKPLDELIAIVLDIAVSCSVNVAQAAVHAVDIYLDDVQEKERHHILELMRLDDAESGEVLLGYAREALRFYPRVNNLWREVMADGQIPQGQDLSPLNVRAGDRLWINFKNANLDPAQFPEPLEIDPKRQRMDYRIFGCEFFSGPIAAFGEQIIVEILQVVLRLKNVRRAEGDLGRITGFKTFVNETESIVHLMPDGSTSCWPGPLHLVYDD